MNKIYLIKACMMVLVIALAGCEKAAYEPEQQSGPNPPLPKAQKFLVPPVQLPNRTGWAEGEKPTVADGLAIEKIASDLLHPRQLLTLPNGDVLVVEANSPGTAPVTSPKQMLTSIAMNRSGKGGKGGNRITLLRKGAVQGGEWEKYVFIEGLNSPFGVQLIDDTLYVANTDNIMKYRYTPDETRMSDVGVEFTDLPDTINHHWTKALLASPDGKKLYVGVGSNSNVGENGLGVEYRRATVLEVDVLSASSRIYASGLRNPTGLGWEPTSGKLWAIVNERDEIGADLAPDYLTSVQEGGFYGWPYSYFGQHVDQRVKPPRPDLVAQAIRPDYSLGSHVAPLGLWFYQGRNLPEKYHSGAFVGQHGSWNRTPLSGYDVVFVHFKDGKPEGIPEPIVTGFVSADQASLKGAPVGLAEDAEGALLIADDVGNTVWRVTAHATTVSVAR